MHSKLPGLASDNMKTCNDATSKTLETKDMPKKKNNNMYIRALFLKEKMSLKKQKVFQFYAD